MTNNSQGVSQERPFFWYQEGLAFRCLGCGRCCRREGAAYLLPQVALAMAERLSLSEEDFQRLYTTNRYRYPSLADCRGGCALLKNDRCLAYDLRPVRCATWPFWPEIVASPQAWEEAAKDCPGMNCGDWWSFEQIQEALKATRAFDDELAQTYGKGR